jgi:hypothetical protein
VDKWDTLHRDVFNPTPVSQDSWNLLQQPVIPQAKKQVKTRTTFETSSPFDYGLFTSAR